MQAAVFLEFASTDAAQRFLGSTDLTWDDRQLVARTLCVIFRYLSSARTR